MFFITAKNVLLPPKNMYYIQPSQKAQRTIGTNLQEIATYFYLSCVL